VTIALGRRIQFGARDSRRAQWDHHLDLIAVRGDCLVVAHHHKRVRCHLTDRFVNLIEKRADLGRIIRILIRH
jgi:hypothetical protein